MGAIWAAVALASIYSPQLEVVDQVGDVTVSVLLLLVFVALGAAVATPFVTVWEYREV